MKNRKLKPWKVKLQAVKKLLFSKNYAVINFKRTGKDTGYVEGFFSKGFTACQIDDLMNSAQLTHNENIASDNYDAVVEEAKQIINS